MANTTPNYRPARSELSGNAGIRLRQVVGGERIDQIAAEMYGDPALWRWIAEFNHLPDPLQLPAGTLLRIPRRMTWEEPE
jgi:nucleoid-associated protein YgaU